MALVHEYDVTSNVAFVAATGLVTRGDYFECIRWIQEDRTLPGAFGVIFDDTADASMQSDFNMPFMTTVVHAVWKRSRALLALVDGRAGMRDPTELLAIAVDGSGRFIRAFASEQVARAWLDLGGAREFRARYAASWRTDRRHGMRVLP